METIIPNENIVAVAVSMKVWQEMTPTRRFNPTEAEWEGTVHAVGRVSHKDKETEDDAMMLSRGDRVISSEAPLMKIIHDGIPIFFIDYGGIVCSFKTREKMEQLFS
jgi:hypothetical protein